MVDEKRAIVGNPQEPPPAATPIAAFWATAVLCPPNLNDPVQKPGSVTVCDRISGLGWHGPYMDSSGGKSHRRWGCELCLQSHGSHNRQHRIGRHDQGEFLRDEHPSQEPRLHADGDGRRDHHGIVATVALRSLTSHPEITKVEVTKQEMGQLVYACVLASDRIPARMRTDFGYVGDIGALPSGFDDLVTNPGDDWNGPISGNNFTESSIDFKTDAWGLHIILYGVTIS